MRRTGFFLLAGIFVIQISTAQAGCETEVARRRAFIPVVDGLRPLENREMLSVAPVVSNLQTNNNVTGLSPANAHNVHVIYQTPVDGTVYGTPQIVSGVKIGTGKNVVTGDVAIVTTETNQVYAIKADGKNAGAILWHDNLTVGPAGAVVTPVPYADVGPQIRPTVGITSGAAVDLKNKTIFVMAYTKQVYGGENHYVWTMHALSLTNGNERGATVIADTGYNGPGSNYIFYSGPTVDGTGAGSVNGKITFNAALQSQRPDPVIVGNSVYYGWAGHNPNPQYHGWVTRLSTQNYQLQNVFNTTPDGQDGGIWKPISVDSKGRIYVVTGNGTAGGGVNGRQNLGDSVIHLTNDLRVAGSFTPPDAFNDDVSDLDLGASTSLMILPRALGSAKHPDLGLVVGKNGIGYFIDLDHLNGGNFLEAPILVQQQNNPNLSWSNGGVAWSHPVVYGNQLFVSGAFQNAQTYQFEPGKAYLKPTPVTTAATVTGYPGLNMTVSSHGNTNGLIIATSGANPGAPTAPNLLQIFDARFGFNHPLFTLTLPSVVKFAAPTVLNNGTIIVNGVNEVVGLSAK